MRDFRILTMLAVIVLSSWTMWRGVQTTAYEFAAQRAMVGDTAAAARLGEWADVRGVAPLALENMMRAPVDPGDPAQIETRRELLAAYLARVPLSSQYWLELAVMRNASGAPVNKISEALALSSLTGPNEANVLLKRAAFALSIWEKIDAETRGRTASDLAVVAPPLNADGIKLALAIKTDKVRSDVRDTLVAHGVPAAVVKYVGL